MLGAFVSVMSTSPYECAGYGRIIMAKGGGGWVSVGWTCRAGATHISNPCVKTLA